ncbi:MAG: xanthine dehydrogenase family protein molybdopterin-binding subunit [Gammaproteobacteria bacterium]|nr:xanthine dehydrogenase family protein molybdopterin-binding subunit [Gammaproteobacteria bacterium]MDP2348407.1 xanthine dehydrogenase family protein molybdopterin-binding subunit [Gammaproteobacteria bacterium]
MKMNRRRFLLATTIIGGGLLIGYASTRPSRHSLANRDYAADGQSFLTTWLRIDPDNTVTVIVPHSEMGQGVHTSLPMMAADEMDADWSKVRVEQAPATDLFANGVLIKGFAASMGVSLPRFLDGLIYKGAEIMNIQITGGSSSVRFTGENGMRVAGAAAREMLIKTAAARWDVPESELTARMSHVHHDATGRAFTFGELATDAARFEPSAQPVLKDPSAFTLMGRSIPRIDIPAKVDGSAEFGIDAQPPGMLYAAVKTSPVFGNKLVAVNSASVMQRRGIVRVVELEDAVAVVADNYWRAKEALAALDIRFEETENNQVSTQSIYAQYDAALQGKLDEDVEEGDTRAALAGAATVIDATYRVPYLAHAAMEPMNCTVHFHNGKCDVWTGTQDNLGIRGRVASIADMNENDVTLHAFYLGGGFGRRLPNATNTIDQATRIAQQFDVPVKTIWSREEDIQQDYYRPAVTSKFRAGFDTNNRLIAWENHYIGQNEPAEAAHTPYSIPNKSIAFAESPTHVPFGAWRSVAHSQHTFFMESFVDELAHRSGQNPYQFRLDMLADKPRHAAVLRAAAERAGWERNLPEGHAQGIALQESFGSIVAQVAEVSITPAGQVRVHRVTCAIDCGRAINPDTVASQAESGVIFGLTAALYGEITIEQGRVAQTNFTDYEMVRLADSPEIDVVTIESGASLGGLGEPATPPIAAAVANAVYILTGQRVRELPLKNYRFAAVPTENV